jgi:hypothetical protein
LFTVSRQLKIKNYKTQKKKKKKKKKKAKKAWAFNLKRFADVIIAGAE